MPRERTRVLFVDDEPELLEAMRVHLHGEGERWDLRFASGASQALSLLAEEPADVVVSDLRMPGMDGAQFLALVRDAYPAAIRLILSGQSDDTQSVGGVAQQWLAKPCDRPRLVNTIERAVVTQRILTSERVRSIVGGVDSLPALPRIYRQLTGVIGDAEGTSDVVGDLVREDAALCARVLEMANSAFFGIQCELTDPKEAVALLGFHTIGQLVLTAEVIEELRPWEEVAGDTFEHFQDHGMLVGRIAARILQGDERVHAASTAGLLHDLGQLVLARRAPAEFGAAWRRVSEEGLPLSACEREAIGASHCEVGGALLGHWGLPAEIVQAVTHHHRPSRVQVEELDPLVAVHVAQALVHPALAEVNGDDRCAFEGEDDLDQPLLARLGLTDRLGTWRRYAREEARDLVEARRDEAA